MELHQAFRIGAEKIANSQDFILAREYGIPVEDMELLTQPEHWSPNEALRVRGILAQCIEVAMTISGMPAVPLPAQYAAAVIATVVSPANRMVACTKVPETFDVEAASGLLSEFEVKPAPREQMMALVMAYSGGFGGEPPMQRLPKEVREAKKKAVNS
jgi:hypothetical protein